MATDPSEAGHWSADPPGRRHADVDEPLFDPDLIPNAGDPRSVGELLRDVDLQARQLLLDVTGDDAAGLLRGWPVVVDAAAQLWHALPGRPTDPIRREDLDRPMTRLSVLSEAVADSLRSARWPGAGAVDTRTDQVATILVQAAGLVQRYRAEIAPEHEHVRRDLQAARTRLMHGVYLSAHAASVALHQRNRDLRHVAAAAGKPIPLSTTRSPYVVGSTARWLQRIGACERIAGDYLAHRFPEQVAGEATTPFDDPTRLRRALASWDIQVHRGLAAHSTPANLVLATRTQALIGDTSVVLLHAAAQGGALPSPDALDRLAPAIEEANHAWNELASRWRDLCLPNDRLDPALARAAGEVRAAYGELTHDTTTLATPATIATRPALAEAVQASLDALEAAAELAYVVSDKANDPDLTGPARAVSVRAHNNTEAAIAAGTRPDTDTVWVTPQDIAANRAVRLPAPVVEGLIGASRIAVASTERAVGRATTHTEAHASAPNASSSPRPRHPNELQVALHPSGPQR